MGIAYFRKNASFEMDNRQYQLIKQVEKGLWQAEETRGGRLHEFKLQNLQRLLVEGKLVFVEHQVMKTKEDGSQVLVEKRFDREVPPILFDQAKLRLAYVKAIEGLPRTKSIIEAAVAHLWHKIQQPARLPHWGTVVRWRNKYLQHGGDIFVLVEQHGNRGNTNERYTKEVVAIVEEAIDQHYMKREPETIVGVHAIAVTQVRRANKLLIESEQLAEPSTRLVRRMIGQIPAFDIAVAQKGQLAATRLFRAKLNHIITNYPLERAEIDHTRLDLFVISDKDFMPLGRPWVTICIDNHTRCILGIYVGFEPPSYLTVAKCLKHAILPKVNLRIEYPEIVNEWQAHGVMEQLVVDNGLEFHSVGLEKACLSFGIEIAYTPRKTPWFKGKIERFNGTLNKGLSHSIPGTTFSNIFEKDDYDPAKHAVITLNELRVILFKWIADVHHQKSHKGLDGVPPAVFWAHSISDENIPLPHNPELFDALLGRSIPGKKITHKGIELNGLLYNSLELIELRRQLGDTFVADIRHVYVVLPKNNDYLKIPALHFAYANGLTLWLHNVYRRYGKQRLGKHDVYGWMEAKTVISEMFNNTLAVKPNKTRNNQGRLADTAQPISTYTQSETSTKKLALLSPAEYMSSISIDLPIPEFETVIEKRNRV
jgi:putative transposase